MDCVYLSVWERQSSDEGLALEISALELLKWLN